MTMLYIEKTSVTTIMVKVIGNKWSTFKILYLEFLRGKARYF